MKLRILYEFTAGPYGGGNQFLKALRGELQRTGSYADTIAGADVVLVNLNPGMILKLLRSLPNIRRRHPKVPIIIRIDGPISLIRGQDLFVDKLIGRIVSLFANAVIFQSAWSKQENSRLGIRPGTETVIHNAPNNSIFYPAPKIKHGKKTRLIATSWSDNKRKGFEVYSFLDQNLDWDAYEMTFVGNSPIAFQHIRHLKPRPSKGLAAILRRHDIYITASQNDPCSNALIEAVSCGLPAVALASGGHPELVRQGGELFTGIADIVPAIERVADGLASYQSRLPVFDIRTIAQAYIAVANRAANTPHRPTGWTTLYLQSMALRLAYTRYQYRSSIRVTN